MTDQVQVSGPIKIEDNSKERVAYDLTKTIAQYAAKETQKNEVYWLTTYYRCLRIVQGYTVSKAQQGD